MPVEIAAPEIPQDQQVKVWRLLEWRRAYGNGREGFQTKGEYLNFIRSAGGPAPSTARRWFKRIAEARGDARAAVRKPPGPKPSRSVTSGRVKEAWLRGENFFADRCGRYLSRNPNSLRSNDVWTEDQKQVDVRTRDGGERLGRIWMVGIEDVASQKLVGWAFGPVLCSEMVMRAAAMAIERYGVPRAIQEDRGKEFACTAFNGKFTKIKGETLYREIDGVWDRLGVRVVQAIGDNPQSKPIERVWALLPKFDERFPGCTGSNTQERPEQLAKDEAAHERWKKHGIGRTPLPRIEHYIAAFERWAEEEYNAGARGRGKYRQGMTPNEAYNVKAPPDGFRRIPVEELDSKLADHRRVKIARGGQINLSFYGQMIEYEDAALFMRQGEEVEVIVSRRTFSEIKVLDARGEFICKARAKPLYDWLPEDREQLRAAMRCNAAMHRAVKRGLAASTALAESGSPVELLKAQRALGDGQAIAQKLYGEPGPRPEREMSGDEWRMRPRAVRKTLTSEEAAEAVLQIEGGGQ